MRQNLLFLILLCHSFLGLSQTEILNFDSKILGETRKIRIHISEIEQDNPTKFPLIIALDGEYMFYNLVASMELLSITECMPKAIIVGIDQNYPSSHSDKFQRWLDCDYDGKTGELEGTGILFKTFIEDELLPYIKSNYNVGNYAAIAGHSFTANYLFYFLKETQSSFAGFLSFSPYIADSLAPKLLPELASLSTHKCLYISTANNDLRAHKTKLQSYDSTIFQKINQENFRYHFDFFDQESHMTLTYPSAFSGLKFLFDEYSPLYKMDELNLDEVENYCSFLEDRYQKIKNIYDITLPYREDDLSELSWIAAENEKWEQLLQLSEWHILLYPESYAGYYNLGSYYEAEKDYRNALKNYEKGYSLLGPEVSNKSDFYEDIDRIKKLMK